MFHALSPRVFAYALRHSDSETAEDVVADTFLVAWRRFGDMPAEPLPWLLVIARNTLSDRRRQHERRRRLTETIMHARRYAEQTEPADHIAIERTAVLSALARLNDSDREVLLLFAWEGLSNSEAAVVAGCGQRAFEVRLSRARARLTQAMADDSRSREQTPSPARHRHPAPSTRKALT